MLTSFKHAGAVICKMIGKTNISYQLRAKVVCAEAIQALGPSWRMYKPNHWASKTPIKHGFELQVELYPFKEVIVCLASAGITIERDFFSRNLAMALLEMNTRYLFGSFRLHNHQDGLSVVLLQFMDGQTARKCDVVEVAESLSDHMQTAIVELYGRDLIMAPFPSHTI